MKRFRGHLFNGTAALSLLVAVVSAALWVRSYFVWDSISYTRSAGEHLELDCTAMEDWSWCSVGFGRIFRSRGEAFGLRWEHDAAERVNTADLDGDRAFPAQIRLPGLRIRWFRRVRAPGVVAQLVLAFRLWIPTLFGLILPLYWWRLRQRARPIEGFCAGCGYDLRATADRCPECGKMPR